MRGDLSPWNHEGRSCDLPARKATWLPSRVYHFLDTEAVGVSSRNLLRDLDSCRSERWVAASSVDVVKRQALVRIGSVAWGDSGGTCPACRSRILLLSISLEARFGRTGATVAGEGWRFGYGDRPCPIGVLKTGSHVIHPLRGTSRILRGLAPRSPLPWNRRPTENRGSSGRPARLRAPAARSTPPRCGPRRTPSAVGR